MAQSLNHQIAECKCPLPVPHRHPNGEHWCDRCGGYLGTAGKLDGPAGSHESEGCHCPPCITSLCGAPKASGDLAIK